jgi:pimeloyl-ACP methyl ester carboxylesterase
MSTYVLIHGAADSAWQWHLVEPQLRERGHDVVAVDLPSEDGSAGFPEYADVVVGAIGDRTDLVVVAHSLGGFTVPLVCARVPVECSCS